MISMLASMVAGCSHAPIIPSGQLSSYDGMKQENGVFTRSLGRSDKTALKQAKTVSIVPFALAPQAASQGLSTQHQTLVANAASRALCNELSRKFVIVPPGAPSDLTVHGTITKVTLTDAGTSAVSKVGSIATAAFVPLPMPLKRLPFGLGGITIEAEATRPDGAQVAAIVWESDANPFNSKPRVSQAGDAYDLGVAFGSEFSRVLKQKQFEMNPEAILASLPAPAEIADNIAYAVDGKPKAAACKAFGDGPGLIGGVAASFGAPPEWTDDGVRNGANRPKTKASENPFDTANATQR